MSMQAKAAFIGLVTATSECGADPGALRKADNVHLRRQGALCLRDTWTLSDSLSRAYRALFWYQGTKFYVADNNVLYTTGQAIVTLPTYPTGTSYAPVRADCFAWEESRKNLYFPTKNGALKLTSGASTTALNTGMSPTDAFLYMTGFNTASSNNWMPANSRVAYRLVVTHTDANGVILRSRPTGATIVDSGPSPGAPVIVMQIDTTRPTNAVHEVELYRTRVFPNTVTPDDEMQLVGTFKASLFTPANGYQFTDTVIDSARTTTLYTSPSRGGMENANDRPPGAALVEGYRGHVFFGNTVGPQRFIVSYKFSKNASGPIDLVGQATGIGMRGTTGNITNGSTSITGVANTTGIQRGMIVDGTGNTTTYPTVTAISGSTITLSAAAGTTQAAATLKFYDAVGIDGTWYPLFYNGLYLATQNMLPLLGGTATLTAYEITPANPGYDVTLVIEHKARGQAPFQVLATHGGEMNPPLGEWGGTNTPSTNDVFIHGLAWSEPDEPEHVPPKNFARVGDGSKAILGLTAMRDSLLIWKEDGLFRLTGAVSSGFRIDPFDPTVQCILPGSIRRLRDSAFCLTTLGITRVTDAAAQVVSAPILPDLGTRIIEPIRRYFATNALYRPPGVTACVSASADESNGEYWLILGSTWESRLGGQILVFNIERGGFTTYTFGTQPSTITGLGQNLFGQPVYMLPTGLYQMEDQTVAPTGNITARVMPYGFYEPGMMGKLWTHNLIGFSQLGNISTIQVTFSSSESQSAVTTQTENLDIPATGGGVNYPGGLLARHVIPQHMRRAWILRTEYAINALASTFVLELMGAESRENISNKTQTIATGTT